MKNTLLWLYAKFLNHFHFLYSVYMCGDMFGGCMCSCVCRCMYMLNTCKSHRSTWLFKASFLRAAVLSLPDAVTGWELLTRGYHVLQQWFSIFGIATLWGSINFFIGSLMPIGKYRYLHYNLQQQKIAVVK